MGNSFSKVVSQEQVHDGHQGRMIDPEETRIVVSSGSLPSATLLLNTKKELGERYRTMANQNASLLYHKPKDSATMFDFNAHIFGKCPKRMRLTNPILHST
jgi:hypothetical protein